MQLSRIMQRVPASDLSGPKALVESLTSQSNLAVVDAADSWFGLLVAVFGSTFSLEQRMPGALSWTVEVPAPSERMIRGGS